MAFSIATPARGRDALGDQPEQPVVGGRRVAIERLTRAQEQRHLVLPDVDAAERTGPGALPDRHNRRRGHLVNGVRQADLLRILVVVGVDPFRIAAHLHDEVRECRAASRPDCLPEQRDRS